MGSPRMEANGILYQHGKEIIVKRSGNIFLFPIPILLAGWSLDLSQILFVTK